MSPTLRQLRAFSAVAELGSFVEAARLLHVTPAALSLLVRELESGLGFRLFDRTTRRVALSEPGQQYLRHAERVLAELRRAERFAEDLKHQRTGVVRIAMTQVMHWVLLPPVLQAFQQRWPQVRVEPADVPTHEIVSSVETGQADLAISFDVPASEVLERTPLFHSRVHAVFHPSHPLAGRKRLNWAQLQGEPLIFIGRGSEMRIRAELPPALTLVSRHEVNNTITALGLVAAGSGVAVCAGYVQPMARLHDLRCVPMAAPVLDRPFVLYRHRTRPPSPAMQAFSEFLTAHYASLRTQPVEAGLALPGP